MADDPEGGRVETTGKDPPEGKQVQSTPTKVAQKRAHDTTPEQRPATRSQSSRNDDNSHTDNESTNGANSDTASIEKTRERPPQPKRGKKRATASSDWGADDGEWHFQEADDDNDNDDETQLHAVERIMESRQRDGSTEYKVRWKGYTSKHDTWEPSHHVTEPAIKEYLQRTSTTHQAKNAHDDQPRHKTRAAPLPKLKSVVDTTKYRHKAVGRQAQLLATRPKNKMECSLCILRGEATRFKIGQMAVHIMTQHQADPEYNEMIEMLQESKIVEDCAKCGHKKPTSTQGEKHHARRQCAAETLSKLGNKLAGTSNQNINTRDWPVNDYKIDDLKQLDSSGLILQDQSANKTNAAMHARILSTIRREIRDDAQKWVITLLLPKLTMFRLPVSGRNGVKKPAPPSRATTEYSRLLRFMRGDWGSLYQEALAAAIDLRVETIEAYQSDSTKANQYKAELKKGKGGSALRDGSSRILPQRGQLDELVAAHFVAHTKNGPVRTHPAQPEHMIVVTEANIDAAIGKANNTHGATLEFVFYWKQVYASTPKLLVALLQEIVSATIPQAVATYLAATQKIVLHNGTKSRFVAPESSLLKLAMSIVNNDVKPTVQGMLRTSSNEMCFSKSHGAAATAQVIQTAYDTAEATGASDFAIISFDVSKAYNGVPKQALLDLVQQHVPRLLAPITVMLTETTHTTMDAEGAFKEYESKEGVGQGSTLSTMLYAIFTEFGVFQKAEFNKEELEVALDKLLMFADDSYLFGDLDTILPIAKKWIRAIKRAGLQIQLEKCQLFMPFAANGVGKAQADKLGLAHLPMGGDDTKRGIKVLQIPVGHSAYVRAQLDIRAHTIANAMQDYANNLQMTAQYIYHMLRSVQSAAEYILEATRPEDNQSFCKILDDAKRNIALKLIRTDDYNALHQELPNTKDDNKPGRKRVDILLKRMEQPHRLGGLGLLEVSPRRHACYAVTFAKNAATFSPLGSALRSQGADQAAISLRLAAQNAGIKINGLPNVKSIVDLVTPHTIKELRDVQLKKDADELVNYLDHNMAFAFGQYNSGITTILSARPNRRDTQFKHHEFLIFVALILGWQTEQTAGVVYAHQRPVKCTMCHENKPLHANHLVSCPCVRNATHSVLRDTVANMLIAAGITVQVEETNVNMANKLRTDITAPNIMSKTSARKDMQIDVTVVNTLNQTVDKTPEQQVKEREQTKLRHYAQLAEAENADIVPAVVTTFGLINDDLRNLIHKAKQEATLRGRYQPGIDPDFAIYWRQNILCSTIRALMSAAQRVTAHQRNHHHGPGVRGVMLPG